MSDAKKKKTPSLSPQERAAQRERRLESDRKAAERIARRSDILKAVPGLNVLSISFSLVPIHLAFYAVEDVIIFGRGFANLTRVQKGNLIMVSCSEEPKGDRPCVAVWNEKCVIAVCRGDQDAVFFNLSSKRREDDMIRVDDSNFIGNIVCILETPDISGAFDKKDRKSSVQADSPADKDSSVNGGSTDPLE